MGQDYQHTKQVIKKSNRTELTYTLIVVFVTQHSRCVVLIKYFVK